MPCAYLDDPDAVCLCAGSRRRQRKCEFWLPSRTHKYARCRQFMDQRILCGLPTSACRTCPHQIKRPPKPLPPMSLLAARVAKQRAYMREYMRAKRAAARRMRVIRVEVFEPGHPVYSAQSEPT